MDEQKPAVPVSPSVPLPLPGIANKALKDSLHHECCVMLDYALKNGMDIELAQVTALEVEEKAVTTNNLLVAYNYLIGLVKPALPGTLLLFEENRKSKSILRSLGPLPIVRHFMGVSIFSLLALILASLSPLVDIENIQMSMLQGHGMEQALRFIFLTSAASVGASFYALFEMNNYISAGTFDTKYSSTYWSRYVLGIVAGILLSELFVVFIETSQRTADSNDPLTSATYLLKPILAILGGFSANLVYRILNRLITAIESIFTGSANQMIAQKQQQFDLENQANAQQIKANSAQNLLALKATLIKNNVPQSVLDQLDQSLAQLVSISPPPKAAS